MSLENMPGSSTITHSFDLKGKEAHKFKEFLKAITEQNIMDPKQFEDMKRTLNNNPQYDGYVFELKKDSKKVKIGAYIKGSSLNSQRIIKDKSKLIYYRYPDGQFYSFVKEVIKSEVANES